MKELQVSENPCFQLLPLHYFKKNGRRATFPQRPIVLPPPPPHCLFILASFEKEFLLMFLDCTLFSLSDKNRLRCFIDLIMKCLSCCPETLCTVAADWGHIL